MGDNISDNYLVPGNYITVDASAANTSLGPSFKSVLIGQRLSTGTTDAEVFSRVFSATDAQEQFGAGSMLSIQFNEWFAKNATDEVYAIALDDAATAVSSAKECLVSGEATETGVIYTYVNGIRYTTAVDDGDDDEIVATNVIATLQDGEYDFGAVAAVIATADPFYSLSFIAMNGGTIGNAIDVRFNMGDGESFPSGISIGDATQATAGSIDPDIDDAIAVLPDEVYKLIVTPYTDSTSTDALITELDRRWGATVKLYGHAVAAYGGTASVVSTFGDTLNSEHLSIIDNGKDVMIPPYQRAASLGAVMAKSAGVDPSLKFSNLSIGGDGDIGSNRRNKNEQNTLLNSGIGIHRVGNDGTVYIFRMVTTYKENAQGATDTSYRNSNTLFNLQDICLGWETFADTAYARSKLADDGTTFGAGESISTPQTVTGDLISYYEALIRLGRVEDLDTFIDSILAERDGGKLNLTWSPILIGQFYQTDSTVLFIV